MSTGLNFQSLTGQPYGFRTVAAAGTTQGTATALATYSAILYNVTGADGTAGVKLPVAVPGKFIMIRNASASLAIKVYPYLAGAINGGTTNAAMVLSAGGVATFMAFSNTGWVSMLGDAGASDTANVNGTVTSKTGLTVTESVSNGLHHSVFTLTAMPLTVLDATVGVGQSIYTFPKGATLIQTASGNVAETTTSVLATTLHASTTYNWGVGTTTQANGTLATTEQDIIPTTNGTSSATINVAGAASYGTRVAAPANFDGSGTAKVAFFNVGIATGTDIDNNATTTWTGTISIFWAVDPTSAH